MGVAREHGGTVRALSDDPFAVLGVSADASAADIAAARRRLARSQHPDHGGDLSGMQALNAAHDEALRRSEALLPPSVVPSPDLAPAPLKTPMPRSALQVQHDSPSFVIDVPPPKAHEALVVAAASIGELIVTNAPHMIECLLDDPLRCWCRLDLVPEGESTSVSLIVERYDDQLAPDIDAVRDEWVSNLNH